MQFSFPWKNFHAKNNNIEMGLLCVWRMGGEAGMGVEETPLHMNGVDIFAIHE